MMMRKELASVIAGVTIGSLLAFHMVDWYEVAMVVPKFRVIPVTPFPTPVPNPTPINDFITLAMIWSLLFGCLYNHLFNWAGYFKGYMPPADYETEVERGLDKGE